MSNQNKEIPYKIYLKEEQVSASYQPSRYTIVSEALILLNRFYKGFLCFDLT